VVAVCRVADVEQTFSAPFIATWLVSAFVLCVLLHYGFRLWVMYAGGGQESLRRVLIVGATSSGRMLAQRIGTNGQLGLDFIGYIDDRMDARIVDSQKAAPLGNLQDLPRIVQQQNIHRVYVSLPMCSQQRILNLVETLKDSTVSLYFIPDLIVFDLIQARVDHVAGLPVLAVCESPFVGLNRFIKRTEDLVLASLILLLIWPLLLLVALMVKLTSPGPVIFVQRRYGMDGRPIDIFKFRSMFVQESGAGESFKQAQKNDARLTPIGALIRKTSLDELPQFFNVLGGSMSIVGPRPHVHALDQLYRSQIKGYMQRNKVKPGITGWAQVNGSRGETAGLEPMRRRIEYDLDYLRDWSLWVDLKIIAMTLLVLIRDPNAY
jgi:putative colanic acid biosynthesis UDP-glucose lipid carrier transferase